MARGRQRDWMYHATWSHCATCRVGSRAPSRTDACLHLPKAALPDALEGPRSPHPRRPGEGPQRPVRIQPVRILLFLLRRYTASGTIDRDVVLAECRRGGLHGVAYASYTQETVGTHPATSGGGLDLMWGNSR